MEDLQLASELCQIYLLAGFVAGSGDAVDQAKVVELLDEAQDLVEGVVLGDLLRGTRFAQCGFTLDL